MKTLCFILLFSSFNDCNCRFHSSTLAVDSCNALVKRVLLLFNVCSSISHFFAFVELIGDYNYNFMQHIFYKLPLSKSQFKSIILIA